MRQFHANLTDGTLLANVGYTFHGAAGALGPRVTSGIAQLAGKPIFSFSAEVPEGALVLIVDDSSDDSNWQDLYSFGSTAAPSQSPAGTVGATIPFLSLLEDCADRCGLLTPEGTVPAVHAAFLARMIQKEVRHGWRWYEWPELTLTERRAYRPVWDAAAGYAAGEEVFFEDDETYYAANAVTSAGESPATTPAKWDAITVDFAKYVALNQSGLARIGEVLGVTVRDPRINRAPGTALFRLSDFGVMLAPDAPARVWVRFRLPTPKFTAIEWEDGTFAAGIVRYHNGDCWEALEATSSEPGADATWALQVIPEFLHDYAVEAVYADWLDDDGQKAKSTLQREDAEDMLADERNQFTRTQGQGQRYGVRTR